MEKITHSLSEFEAEAVSFSKKLIPHDNRATLITLSGELGAGKTVFTKSIAKAFGIKEVVHSPTFVLEKIYQLPEGSLFTRLIHIDSYRLESGADLGPLGYDILMKDVKNLIVLEWPEKVADALAKPTHHISLTVLNETSRKISYDT